MRTNKKEVGTQRRLMDKKVHPWLALRPDRPPPSGWLKAIRGALGMSARELASIVGIDPSAIIRMEEREPHGKVTLELIEKVTRAMGCKIIYAIVPDNQYNSLEDIVDQQSRKVAKELIERVEHSMRLEDQGSSDEKIEIERLANELKNKMDSRIWRTQEMLKKKMGSKA